MPGLPQQFLNSLSGLPGLDLGAFEEAHSGESRLTSIRLNPFKSAALDFETGTPVLWNPLGSYLAERPYFTYDPLFHAGCYYVQEAGSMFVGLAMQQALNLERDLKVLDLCAAPGGKSTLINSLINSQSLLVANEVIKSRADVLAQNLSRWGTANCIVTNNYPDRFTNLGPFFDAMVIDAPCSGSGLFRKQPEAIGEWSEGAVIACSQRQKDILNAAIPALKQDGVLIYSTCSYSTQENEDIVKWLIAEHGFEYKPLHVEPQWGIVETGSGYRFYPHKTQSEGFFCAVLVNANGGHAAGRPHKISATASKAELAALEPFLNAPGLPIHKINGRLHLLNEATLNFISRFEKGFYFKKAGTLLGELKGGKLVPEQELAWSVNLGEGFEKLDLDKEAAVKYLKKENFIAADAAQGLALITYKNHGLGWAKLLGNRVNNYLPNEIRILK